VDAARRELDEEQHVEALAEQGVGRTGLAPGDSPVPSARLTLSTTVVSTLVSTMTTS
jgi:hypothetical protein